MPLWGRCRNLLGVRLRHLRGQKDAREHYVNAPQVMELSITAAPAPVGYGRGLVILWFGVIFWG
jgi:hypothetical protein